MDKYDADSVLYIVFMAVNEALFEIKGDTTMAEDSRDTWHNSFKNLTGFTPEEINPKCLETLSEMIKTTKTICVK